MINDVDNAEGNDKSKESGGRRCYHTNGEDCPARVDEQLVALVQKAFPYRVSVAYHIESASNDFIHTIDITS